MLDSPSTKLPMENELIKVAVVYFTKTDVTGKLAQSLISGLKASGEVRVIEHRIQGHEIVEGRFVNHDILSKLSDCEAIIFGTPTYMGGVSAQFKSFADATSDLWCDQEWSGKYAAGFTCGSAMNGDQTGTLQYLVTLSNQQGMLWVGLDSANGYKDHGVNRLGCQLGVVAHSPDGEAHEADLASAKYLGQRVAKQVLRVRLKPNNSTRRSG